jgi:aryl-alcohol dehydrogenase-like predicted oxidoreductase
MRSVEGSLKRLNTSYIDLLYLHMWDGMTPVEEVMRSLDDLVRTAKVLYIGISDTPAWVIAQANTMAELRGWAKFVALQAPYSLAGRDLERGYFQVARAFGMSVIPWGILEGGELTGKYNQPGEEPRRSEDTSQHIKDLASVLTQMGKEIGHTPSQVAINWVRQQPGSIIPILGARSEKQMRDNLGCLDFDLSQEQIDRLAAASPFQPGFSYDFLTSDHVHGLIFGDTYGQIQA